MRAWALLIGALSLLLFAVAQECHPPEVEVNILTSLYESTGGDWWVRNENWLQGSPCSGWAGVRCSLNAATGECHISSLIMPSNNMTGTLPSDMLMLSSIDVIDVSDNQLRGNVPTLNVHMALLVDHNVLNGTVGDLRSPTLMEVDMGYNQLTGLLPRIHSTSIVRLALSHNQFRGTVPPLNSMPNLVVLELQHNNLHGIIPPWDEVNQLLEVHLNDNFLIGTVPPLLHHRPMIFKISNNNLAGQLPSELQENPHIPVFNASMNSFSCPVPEWCSEDGNGLCAPCSTTNSFCCFYSYNSACGSPHRPVCAADECEPQAGWVNCGKLEVDSCATCLDN